MFFTWPGTELWNEFRLPVQNKGLSLKSYALVCLTERKNHKHSSYIILLTFLRTPSCVLESFRSTGGRNLDMMFCSCSSVSAWPSRKKTRSSWSTKERDSKNKFRTKNLYQIVETLHSSLLSVINHRMILFSIHFHLQYKQIAMLICCSKQLHFTLNQASWTNR